MALSYSHSQSCAASDRSVNRERGPATDHTAFFLCAVTCFFLVGAVSTGMSLISQGRIGGSPEVIHRFLDDNTVMRFVIRLLGTMLGIWLSTLLIPGISIPVDTSLTTTLLTLAGIALVLTVVNGIVRPIIGVLAFPLYLLTFGLFALVTNAIVFMAAGWASTFIGIPFTTGGFIPSLLGGTLTAIVSAIVVAVLGKDKRRDD